MNKSKFLKKSLAMVLAIMMVVAMIPMSAFAAEYTPTSTVEPVAGAGYSFTGDPVANSNGWTVEFSYTETTPKLAIRLGATGESIRYVNEDGQYATATSGQEIQLWEKDDAPVDLQFQVYKTTDTSTYSKTYTVSWSVADPSTEITVKSAKLDGTYAADVDNTAGTIEFTVPFGYTSSNELAIVTNDNVTGTESTFTGTVASARQKGEAQVMTLRAQDGVTTKDYTITVEEGKALTAFAMGEYAGTFEKNDEGLETGVITVDVPATTKLDEDDKLLMVPTFTVGSAYKKVEIVTDNMGTKKEIVSGEEFNFGWLLNTANTGNSAEITVTSADDTTVTYTLKLVVDGSSTEISGFTVTDASGFVATGVVNGNKLTAEVSSKTNALTNMTVAITAPSKAEVKVGNDVVTEDGTTAGLYEKTGLNYTEPVSITVTSPDKKYSKVYTLTVTQAEDANKTPAITAAKLTLDEDGEDVEYTGSISGTTITFTVPYSTTKDEVKDEDAYSFAKSAQTKQGAISFADDPFASNASNTVKVVSDGDDEVTYKIVFKKEAAKTGKSISDFILTEATNVNLVDYNTTYKVTASGNKLKVTMPKSVVDAPSGSLQTTFTLSEGAKFYQVDSDALTPVASDVDKDTGAISSTIDLSKFLAEDQEYVIVDEYLAFDISTGAVATLSAIKNTVKYASHYTVYTVEATATNRTQSALTAISADDGLVTGSIKNKEITLTVPASYYDKGTTFFLDFTVSAGATLKADSTEVINGGVKTWNSDAKKVENADADSNNPNFKVVDGKLQAGYGSSYSDVTNLNVVSESGLTTPYTVTVKKADANTGAEITSAKVGNTTATISGKTISVNLPFGTNLGAQKLELTASKLAEVTVGSTKYTEPMTVSLTKDVTITVVSEDGNTKNVYTLTAKVAEQFSDVSTDDWFYDYVMDAVDAGIIVGLGDGRFNPKGNITRGDFALMTVRMLGVDVSSYTTTPFSDVDNNKYYAKAIAYCADKGIIGGVGDGRFAPESYITREQAAKILAEALELDGTTTEKFNDDANIAGWAKDYVYACKAAGIFQGDEKGNFNPKKNITRAEAAKVMVVAQSK